MKSISLRIRKRYFDAIMSGKKTVEYRVDSPYWRKRLGYPTPFITKIERIRRPDGFSTQGQQDVPTSMCYAIYLGEVVHR